MTTISIDQIQNGYPGLAKFMGGNLDQGLGIFKQFAELNTRSLLYMQAELLCLQQELDVITHVDEHGTDPSTKNFARSVWEMKRPPNKPQWEKVLEIRRKLKDYSVAPPMPQIVRLGTDTADDDCLLQQASIAKLDRANKNDQKWLRVWLQHNEGGKSFLEGCEYRAYDEVERPDLISISSRPSDDRFTRWLEMSLIPHLPTRLRKRILVSIDHTHTFTALTVSNQEPMAGSEETGIGRVKLEVLHRFARALNVVLSAIIPSTAIVALYMINNLPYRIAAVAAFSGVFASVLAIFTTARPVEIFAATAA